MTAAREHAGGYHGRGWGPIPVKHGSKATSLPELAPYLERRPTQTELESWSWPGVGIVTGHVSGVLVLDVDGPEGEAELRKHGHPPTPIVRTPGGGLHLYFKHPEQHVRTGIRVAPGLDVKASGGYVVAPPSVGAGGGQYEWVVSPDDAELADPPAWFMELIKPGEKKGPAPPVGERIPDGERNRTLASMAGTMRRRGMGEAEILAALRVANERRCNPPLESREVEKIASSVAQYEPEPPDNVVHITVGGRGVANAPANFNLTDLGNAERLLSRYGVDVCFCYPWSRWLVWNGSRWERDEGGRVHRLAKQTVRGIYAEAAAADSDERRKSLAKHATASEAEGRIKSMLELAKSDVPVSPDELDANPWLLNATNGTVDLRTGELRPHRREDLLTKLAPVEYDPDAKAPAWEAFLERVLPGEELRGFVQRGTGYSATGDTSEQCMFINHGAGANGKSTFQEATSEALGDYAMRAPTEMLMVKRSGGVPNDVARLKGARFVSASETEEGKRLAESLVKDLTGQDTITARFMRAEFFDFKPSHKLWLSTNHKPEIKGTDNAIWRRIRLIPWAVTIPPAEQDRQLAAKLRAELAGVLAWIVRGCIEWQRDGLRAPEEVRRATGEYRAEMDVISAFLKDCCEQEVDGWVYARELYKAYRGWCEETGERPETQKKFGGRLKDRGHVNRRGGSRGAALYDGLQLGGYGEALAEGSLTHQKMSFSRGSDPSDPKNHINDSEKASHGVMCKERSEGSEGSASEWEGSY